MDLPKAPEDQEQKNIIDQLAQIVARNGFEFEQVTKQKQKDNPNSPFLFGGEYFNYYQYRVSAEQAILKQQKEEQLRMQQARPQMNTSSNNFVTNPQMAVNHGNYSHVPQQQFSNVSPNNIFTSQIIGHQDQMRQNSQQQTMTMSPQMMVQNQTPLIQSFGSPQLSSSVPMYSQMIPSHSQSTVSSQPVGVTMLPQMQHNPLPSVIPAPSFSNQSFIPSSLTSINDELKLKHEIEKNAHLTETSLLKDLRIKDLEHKLANTEKNESAAVQRLEMLEKQLEESERLVSSTQDKLECELKDKLELTKHCESVRCEIDLKNETIDKLTTDIQKNKEIIQKIEAETQSIHSKLECELKDKLELMKHCENLKCEIGEKNETIESLTADMQKANEIIRKLQTETQNVHSKLEVLNKVATKQDEVVNEKESKVKKLENDLKICLERIMKKEEDMKILKDEVTSLRQRYEESQQQIKTNENVISWLNKKLTELQNSEGVVVQRASDRVTDRTQTTSNVNRQGLPEVNLVTNKKEGLTVRGLPTKTIPKYVYEKNPMFAKGLSAKVVK